MDFTMWILLRSRELQGYPQAGTSNSLQIINKLNSLGYQNLCKVHETNDIFKTLNFEGLKYIRRLGFRDIELNIDYVLKIGAMRSNMRYTEKYVGNGLDWEACISLLTEKSINVQMFLANIDCLLDCNIIYFDDCRSYITNSLMLMLEGSTQTRSKKILALKWDPHN
jgi:hypothetical protein